MSSLVIVGGGPRATGVLLALAAALRDRAGAGGPGGPGGGSVDLHIHVIDPFPVGAGRIWRADQSRVLWMNSTAAEITVYAPADDGSAGPAPVTGPDLASWITTVTDRPADRQAFIPRRDLSAYLSDAVATAAAVFREVPGVEFTVHTATATAVDPVVGPAVPVDQAGTPVTDPTAAGTRTVTLDDGTVLTADAVLLAQGHLDTAAAPVGPGHVPPGYTADTDWSHLHGGEPVIVRGFGLAFIDLMMLLTEGRGGRFLRDGPDGVPVYAPSGEEPVLWVGSGRGVPYRSKLTAGPLPAQLRYLPDAARHTGPDGKVPRETLARLLDAELTLAWYTALVEHHPERTTLGLAELRVLTGALADGGPGAADALADAVTRHVPAPADRFDPAAHSTPLAGRRFAARSGPGGLEAAVARTVAENLDRATGEEFRQDGALYGALVAAYFALHALAADGLVAEEDRQEFLLDRVGSDFSYTCSGPPPERLENLLALHRAGIVRFLGPDLQVRADDDDDRGRGGSGAGGFVASSPAVPGEVRALHLVDARLARVDPAQVTDPLLRGLLAGGEVTATTAGFVVDGTDRVTGATGEVSGDLFLVGPASSAQVPEAFGHPARPGRVFAANARLAASLLDAVGVPGVAPVRPASSLRLTLTGS